MSGNPFEPCIYPKRPSRDSCHVTVEKPEFERLVVMLFPPTRAHGRR